MKALLLAAGFGTRLLPITEKIPKCLVKINEISMLEFWLRKLQINEISTVVVNTHHLADLVINEINQSNTSNNVQIFHEHKLLGTAGTLLANLDSTLDSEVIVVHCDNFSDIDIGDFLSAHRKRHRECLITMAIFETNNVQMSGMIEIDEDGIARKFIEKPRHSELTMANAAVYIFDKQALNEIHEKYCGAQEIVNDILIHFIGRIQTYSWPGFHMDMGTLENLKTIRDRYESKI
jgi:mannose-1-phosphate guanylyltransferase